MGSGGPSKPTETSSLKSEWKSHDFPFLINKALFHSPTLSSESSHGSSSLTSADLVHTFRQLLVIKQLQNTVRASCAVKHPHLYQKHRADQKHTHNESLKYTCRAMNEYIIRVTNVSHFASLSLHHPNFEESRFGGSGSTASYQIHVWKCALSSFSE